ncbi:MAG: LysM domain-containing protein [Solirubrobacteraceae bacterium]
MVGWRNPARYLAPLAIAAVAAAAYLIVHKALVHEHAPAPTPIVQTSSTSTASTHAVSLKTKFYVVQPNDTLSKIAAHTGVSVATLEALNPGVNPNALHPSQRLRLRR